MEKQLNFKFKARLANLFGTELVSSPSVALGELVKNAYDADATEVILMFSNIRNPGGTKDLYLLFSPFREEEQNFKVLVIADEFPSFEGEIESEILDAAVVHGRAVFDNNRHLSIEISPREQSTPDEEQTPLLKRYHELVDKQMIESLSALEKAELDAIKKQLDEMDESDETLQRAEMQMDARRKLFDEQLEKISGQLQALLEQM